MKIVVTAKLVPDPNAQKRIDPQTKRLVRNSGETVINPFDEYALEAALQLKEALGGETTVTVFTMYPETGKEIVRKALAMGADDAVILSDEGLAGSDVWASGYAIAQALQKTGFDLIVCGGLSDDGNSGGVPGMLAEYLRVPGVTNARKVEVRDGRLHAQRETDTGYQVVSAPLPALVSVTMAVGEPRYASLRGIMGAKKKTIAITQLAELALEQSVGTSGSKTAVVQIDPPQAREKATVVEAPDGATGARAIFDFLKQKKLV